MTHPYWTRLSIASHEAAHAVAAQAMGLRVAWVSIEDIESEGEIYKAATGIEVDGDDSDMMKLALNVNLTGNPQLMGVCVSMAMPSFTTTTTDPYYEYSIMEYRHAIRMAEEDGLLVEEIDHHCEKIKDERWEEINDLAQRLAKEGRIEFASAT